MFRIILRGIGLLKVSWGLHTLYTSPGDDQAMVGWDTLNRKIANAYSLLLLLAVGLDGLIRLHSSVMMR